MSRQLIKYISPIILGFIILFAGCINNDLPYPRIPQLILAIEAEGQSKEAYIDSIAYEVNIYLDETTDIQNVRFSKYEISPGAVSTPDLLQGTYDLSSPLFVSLSRFQEYNWEIICHQTIERYFEVEGQIGESVIDPKGCRVVVTMPEGTDLSNLILNKVKLGPEGITTLVPDLSPGSLNLSHPLRIAIICHGRTEIWTIYAEIAETIVSTTQVDAWSRVIWAYGSGKADADKGFEYREASSSEWIRVPKQQITFNQGLFSCYISHLEPLTEYVVRTYSGEDVGNEIKVTTQATADIPDGDFDQWSQQKMSTGSLMWNPWSEGGSQFWDTGNQGSIIAKVNLTTPSDHTATGSGRAARCETQMVTVFGLGKLGAGSIFTGKYLRTVVTNGLLGFGQPWTLRPTALKGYFQYSAKPITKVSEEFEYLKGQPDTCHIYVALTDWTEPLEVYTKPSERVLFNKDADYVIAYGELTYSGEMSAYKPFEIKLKYRDTSRVPTYLQITCAASKYGDYFTGGEGSVLYVDQFSFDWDLP